jgi:hypothetical protein
MARNLVSPGALSGSHQQISPAQLSASLIASYMQGGDRDASQQQEIVRLFADGTFRTAEMLSGRGGMLGAPCRRQVYVRLTSQQSRDGS